MRPLANFSLFLYGAACFGSLLPSPSLLPSLVPSALLLSFLLLLIFARTSFSCVDSISCSCSAHAQAHACDDDHLQLLAPVARGAAQTRSNRGRRRRPRVGAPRLRPRVGHAQLPASPRRVRSSRRRLSCPAAGCRRPRARARSRATHHAAWGLHHAVALPVHPFSRPALCGAHS